MLLKMPNLIRKLKDGPLLVLLWMAYQIQILNAKEIGITIQFIKQVFIYIQQVVMEDWEHVILQVAY